MRVVGYFVEPTLFAGVRHDMRIACEEMFGPAALVLPFRDEDDAVFQGNDTDYGLAAAILSVLRAAAARKFYAYRLVYANDLGYRDIPQRNFRHQRRTCIKSAIALWGHEIAVLRGGWRGR